MELEKWKAKNSKAKPYAHFDNRIRLDQCWKYISDSKNIVTHAFYPFIHYTQRFIKYNKKKGEILKERELYYCAHIDRYIYQYYSYKLNELYNARVLADGLDMTAIAYRNNLSKNNIHFAKIAFDFIRKNKKCFILVGDFTSFFDNLDHNYLKECLCDLIGDTILPDDLYAVFKNITKFSKWELEDLLFINGLSVDNKGISQINKQKKVLSLKDFKQLKNKYVHKRKENYGIPQGSPISSILSNIYMLTVDKKINDFVKSKQGLYMRYSDDFIIVLPNCSDVSFLEYYNIILKDINSVPKLVLQRDKTKIYKFSDLKIINCNQIISTELPTSNNYLSYLGFTFDGNKVYIRDKTITKYYYRMYKKTKSIIKNNGITCEGNRISCRNLYNIYSIKGAFKDVSGPKPKNKIGGNFITYAIRAKKIFDQDKAVAIVINRHMQKIRKKLKLIKSQ